MSEFLKLRKGIVRKAQIVSIMAVDANSVAEFKHPPRIHIVWVGGNETLMFDNNEDRDLALSALEAQMELKKEKPKKRKPKIVYG